MIKFDFSNRKSNQNYSSALKSFSWNSYNFFGIELIVKEIHKLLIFFKCILTIPSSYWVTIFDGLFGYCKMKFSICFYKF